MRVSRKVYRAGTFGLLNLLTNSMRYNNTEIFKTYSVSKSEKDSGCPESQIALFTHRIKHLTEHLNLRKNDLSAKLSLLKLVGKRKRFLAYLKNNSIGRYRDIVTSLGLRK